MWATPCCYLIDWPVYPNHYLYIRLNNRNALRARLEAQVISDRGQPLALAPAEISDIAFHPPSELERQTGMAHSMSVN